MSNWARAGRGLGSLRPQTGLSPGVATKRIERALGVWVGVGRRGGHAADLHQRRDGGRNQVHRHRHGRQPGLIACPHRTSEGAIHTVTCWEMVGRHAGEFRKADTYRGAKIGGNVRHGGQEYPRCAAHPHRIQCDLTKHGAITARGTQAECRPRGGRTVCSSGIARG